MAVAIEDRHCQALLVNGVYFRVHMNHAFFLFDPFVSGINKAIHPVLERLSDQGVDTICYVLTWELVDLSVACWQCLLNLWVGLGKIKHCFDLEAFELRQCDVFGFSSLDYFPLA